MFPALCTYLIPLALLVEQPPAPPDHQPPLADLPVDAEPPPRRQGPPPGAEGEYAPAPVTTPDSRGQWTFSGDANEGSARYKQQANRPAVVGVPSPDAITAPPPSAYQGVTLAGEQRPPALDRGQRAVSSKKVKQKPAVLTWSGFSRLPEGGVAVFIEVNQPVTPTLARQGKRAQLVLPNTRVPVKNNRHHLDTRYFNSVVQNVHISSRKGQTAVWLDLNQERDPVLLVRPSGHGQTMIVMQFPTSGAPDTSVPGVPGVPGEPASPAAPQAPGDATPVRPPAVVPAGAVVLPSLSADEPPPAAPTPIKPAAKPAQSPAPVSAPSTSNPKPVRYD